MQPAGYSRQAQRAQQRRRRCRRWRRAGSGVIYDRGGPDLRASAPVLGEHSAQILGEIGYSKNEVAALADTGVTRLAS